VHQIRIKRHLTHGLCLVAVHFQTALQTFLLCQEQIEHAWEHVKQLDLKTSHFSTADNMMEGPFAIQLTVVV